MKATPQTQAARPAAVGTHGDSGIAPLPDARLFYKAGDYEEVPHDSMRRTIAKRLTSAKSLIPHYYLTVDCDIGALMEIRARLNDAAPKGPDRKTPAYKLSINDFVLKAAAMALIKHPDVNASWTETALLKHRHADIGVAVDLNPGLITPIVFRAEEKGLIAISNEVKSLAERAKEKKLKPSDYEGGGFSISNLGMFGMKQFTAVINPPEAGILAVGAITRRPLPPGALERGFTLALDGIQDPGNVGTLLRIADWYGVERVLLSPDCADLFSQKVINASMGSFARVVVHTVDLAAALTGRRAPVLGCDLAGDDVHGLPRLTDAVVVIGSEGRGLSEGVRRLVTRRVTIPRFGAAESLNAAVAAAIVCDCLRSGR